jgi:phosphoglucomutase/phosphomannomutase
MTMMATALPHASLFDRLAAAKARGQIAESTERRVRLWLTDPAYASYRSAVAEHVEQERFRELDDAFWDVLPFGTGGRRGKMYPIGTNVMNERTVGESAQGLADYLREQLGATASLSCVIAYDTRRNSESFARLSAEVLAGNGVRVFLFRACRATPQLSFAVRHMSASAGIVISASHNPPSDNGFKCSWSTGGQVLPPHDAGIIRCVETVREIRRVELETGVRQGLITWLGPQDDEAYIHAVRAHSLSTARGIRIVYTPLHGVGMTSVARVLRDSGFNDLHVVESQATPDGSFPNVANQSPNPEQSAALREAIDLARRTAADLVLASDPDADRIAAAVPTPGGDWQPLTGNQAGALMADYVIRARASTGRLPSGSFVVKTLVTTELITRIAEAVGIAAVRDLPVGFKWIGDAIDRNGPDRFLFGAEESLGYLAGSYARDKDAALAALLLAELAAEVKAAGKTMLGHLDELYGRHGYHVETALSKTRPGREGAAEIARIMRVLRTSPPRELAGLAVAMVHDFVDGTIRDVVTGRSAGTTAGPRQQQFMLEFTQPGWRLVGRPSGTEPKIKFYIFGVVAPDRIAADGLAAAKQEAASIIERMGVELDDIVAKAAK